MSSSALSICVALPELPLPLGACSMDVVPCKNVASISSCMTLWLITVLMMTPSCISFTMTREQSAHSLLLPMDHRTRGLRVMQLHFIIVDTRRRWALMTNVGVCFVDGATPECKRDETFNTRFAYGYAEDGSHFPGLMLWPRASLCTPIRCGGKKARATIRTLDAWELRTSMIPFG